MAEKAEKQSPGKLFGICRKLMYILTVPFFIIILIVTMIAFGAKSNNGIASFMGMQALQIVEETMLPEYKKGDVVLIQKANVEELKVGDKVAYYEYLGEDKADKTHSNVNFNVIVAIEKSLNPQIQENYEKLFFQMQGTNAEFPEEGWIRQDYVVGIIASQNGFMENFLIFASSMTGVVALAVVPAAIELILIVIYIVGYKKQSKKADEKDEAEVKEKLAKAQQPNKQEEVKNADDKKLDKQSSILEQIKAETKTEPKVTAKTEPVKVEPAKVETKAEPKVVAKPEPVKVEPAKVVAQKPVEQPKVVVQTEPAKAEPTNVEIKVEPSAVAQAEPTKVEIKVEPAKVEIKVESPKVEPVKVVEQPKVVPAAPKAPPAPPKTPPVPPKAPPAPPKAPPAPPVPPKK